MLDQPGPREAADMAARRATTDEPAGGSRMRPPPVVSESQRTVLYALKRRGEATVDDVATSVGITVSGARQHLAALLDAGLITHRDEPQAAGTRGRPRRWFRLTPAAEPLFPKAYGELTNELLDYLDDEDGTLVEKIFVRRRQHRIDSARRRLAGRRTLRGKAAELARILDEDGYLASFEALPDGTFRVAEHNCAILSVAEKHPMACGSELDFIRAVLPDAEIERVSHMASGDHHCAYVVRPAQVSRPAALGRG